MNYIDENVVLDFYLKQMEQNNIKFLVERNDLKERIKENILKLKDVQDMHDKIQIAKDLWKALFEAGMSYIDPDMRGYDALFTYFDEYVNFEELIFASDSFYRDHTMHCLWVYFLGEYLMKNDEFKSFFKEFNFQIRDLLNIKSILDKSNYKETFSGFTSIIHLFDSLNYEDSMWCIAALTHDLGYPLKKVYKINNCISKILPYYSINNYNEFDFTFNAIQQNFIENFIKLMTISAVFSPNHNIKLDNLLKKVFIYDERNSSIGNINEEELSTFTQEELDFIKTSFILEPKINDQITKRLQYFNDFEQYQHGIMSAFLLVKTVKSFTNTKFSYCDNVNVDVDNIDMKDLFTKQSILSAISDHTNENFQITGIYDISEVLILIDELEEFSRISRANMNRQFIEEFCKSNIYFKDDVLNIDFIFDNANIINLDPEKAFKGRCQRFLTLFNIRNLNENLKIKLSCIGRLPYDENTYTLEIRRKYVNITINGEEQNIPKYLKSSQFYTKEMYMKL